MNLIKITLTILLVALIFGCSSTNRTLSRTENEHSLIVGNNTVSYKIGQISLPLNRKNSNSKKFKLTYYYFPRKNTASKSTPPIFVLPGGPSGKDMVKLLEKDWYYPAMIAPYLEYTDYIVVNHRGFLNSFDTSCNPAKQIPINKINDDEYILNNFAHAAKSCRKKWESQEVELRSFNSLEASADVKDLATSLGYDKIQILGNSYGSHWGLNVTRYFPNIVARATFSAIEGPDHTYDMPSEVLNVLEAIALDAGQHPNLHKHMPKEGLIKAYKQKIDDLNQTPITVRTQHPGTNELFDYLLDGDDLKDLLFGYNSGVRWRYQMKNWPIDILKIINGDYSQAVQELMFMKFSTSLNEAAYYQTDCASGLSKERGEVLRNDEAYRIIGKTWSYYDHVCSFWDADLGDEFRSPFTSDVPTLLVHGTWDAYTPISNALEVLPMLNNGKLIVIKGGSHGALREAKEDNDEFAQSIHQWLSSGNMNNLPNSVTLSKLKWSPVNYQ